MKRGATREDIVRMTQELIARNGIRAVRVDEIAQMLGISKRTLYEMFADKTELVNACLEAMSRRQQQHISATSRRRGGNSLLRTLKLVNTYIEGLFSVESSFLADIRHKVVFSEYFEEHRTFWHGELVHNLRRCREDEFLLPEIEADVFARRIFDTLLEMRQNGASREELNLFCRTILRGAATRRGIELIDGRK